VAEVGDRRDAEGTLGPLDEEVLAAEFGQDRTKMSKMIRP
jgi:hypothetical protein